MHVILTYSSILFSNFQYTESDFRELLYNFFNFLVKNKFAYLLTHLIIHLLTDWLTNVLTYFNCLISAT